LHLLGIFVVKRFAAASFYGRREKGQLQNTNKTKQRKHASEKQ